MSFPGDVAAGGLFSEMRAREPLVTRRTVWLRYVWIESAGSWVVRCGEMDFTILAPDIFSAS